jgi:DNA-binding NarL/FixJ family response regulator
MFRGRAARTLGGSMGTNHNGSRAPVDGWAKLTPTELAVVRHARTGLTNPEIAEQMSIARGTVKVHLSNVYAKLGVKNRTQLAGVAHERLSTGVFTP